MYLHRLIATTSVVRSLKNWYPVLISAPIRYGLIQLLLIGGLVQGVLAQTTYYVAANGNDSNDGRSASSPFLSLSNVNALRLQPGDQVLLRRGDTFRGGLLIRQSGSAAQPIVFDAYGTGAKPVLSGSEPLTNWTNLGKNRWQATCSGCTDRVTGLYRSSNALPMGRYPNPSDANKGYLTVQSHTGKTQLTSQQPLSANWTGGEAVYRPVQWILNRATITGQTGNTLNLVSSGNYDISDNWGYFIQNHPATLDQAGEWYYDPATKTIQLFDNQTNPNDQAHTATVFAEAVRLSGVSFVNIRNLHITQALATGLLVDSGTNVVIANNDITQSGEDGIAIRGDGSQVVLENNLIEDINNNGVGISAYQNVTVRGNTIRRIGLIAGRGKSGDGTYVGFQSASTANTLIEDNVFDNIGYNALNFSTSTTIQRNRISNFCLTKSDGSGIYIWNGNQQPMSDIHIRSNVVYNGIGAPEGAPGGTHSGANGIYLDDCTTNMEVSGNSVSNCRGSGIYLHGSSNIKLTGNTAYNNGEGQLAIMSANGCQPRTNVIRDNILVSHLASQFTVKYESNHDDLVSYGQFDNNVYARPFEDTRTILAVYNRTTGAAHSLAEWQNRYGKDLTSVNSPVTYTSGNPDDYIRYIANATANPAQFSLDGRYRNVRNNAHSGQVTVPAFSSVVLLKEIAQPSVALRDPENPADAVAGLDYQYYEGNWNNVPDFNALTPTKTGTVASPDLAVRNRSDNFALSYKGYVSIPADGVYTFYTNSDDGTKLLIGSTEVVNNDGPHAVQERSGSIGLKAGVHALAVGYLQKDGGRALGVSYAGPGLGKQAIPTTAFFRIAVRQPVGETGTGMGLRAEYFNNQTLTAPVVLSRVDATVDFDWGTTSPASGVSADNFSVRWTGQVQAPVSGNYTFATLSDDGVRLWVNGTLLINNWTGHAPTTNTGPPMALVAGQRYDIRMEYFEGPVGAVAKLLWDYPGQGRQVIPQRQLYPAGSGRVAAVGIRELDSNAAVLVYPVPARDEVRVRYFADVAGDATLQLVSTAARPVLRETYSVVRGENLLRVPVQNLPRGMYLLTLIQGQQRTTRKIVLTD